jgi:hypothetical protein
MQFSFKRMLRRAAERAGFDIVLYKPRGQRTQVIIHRRRGEGPAQYEPQLGIEGLFTSLEPWVTRFEIEGVVYGGSTEPWRLPEDDQNVDITNHPRLRELVDFSGRSVLELGPLEGANTLLLRELGADRIVSVEGRAANVQKCCLIKNLLHLDEATFVLDDARHVSVDRYGAFDIAFVAGLLYHLDRPDKTLQQLAPMARTLVLSTHFADLNSPSRSAPVAEIAGKYRGKLFQEGPLLDPSSGLQAKAFWPFEEDLLAMITDAGFDRIDVIDRRMLGGYRLIYLVAHTPNSLPARS